jgi:hypothetical protein
MNSCDMVTRVASFHGWTEIAEDHVALEHPLHDPPLHVGRNPGVRAAGGERAHLGRVAAGDGLQPPLRVLGRIAILDVLRGRLRAVDRLRETRLQLGGALLGGRLRGNRVLHPVFDRREIRVHARDPLALLAVPVRVDGAAFASGAAFVLGERSPVLVREILQLVQLFRHDILAMWSSSRLRAASVAAARTPRRLEVVCG